MNNNISASHKEKLFSPIEIAGLLYAIITGIYILCMGMNKPNAVPMLLYRLLFIAITFIVARFCRQKPSSGILAFIRFVIPFIFLGYWYPETFYLNNYLISNQDAFVSSLDLRFFGCEPSIVFSEAMPQRWFSEWMCFSYLSYYFIFCGTALYLYFRQQKNVARGAFIILFSFYLYYIIFILLPVAGPQFYFKPPLNELANTGGFFRNTLKFLLDGSEKPTGAFPSSHVGITFITLMIAWRYQKPLFYWLLIPSLALAAATVYIKAHYLVDVIGGFISVPLMYYISNYTYTKLDNKIKIQK